MCASTGRIPGAMRAIATEAPGAMRPSVTEAPGATKRADVHSFPRRAARNTPDVHDSSEANDAIYAFYL